MPDESSLPFFDRTATAAGGFPVSRRGYDKQAVDDYVRALEMQLVEARNRADELQAGTAPLQRQLEETRRQLEASANPSYAGLGDRAAQILRLAQDQASEALEEARREADELRSTAAKEAANARATGEREAEDIRSVALNEADSLRRTAEGDAAELRRTAETEAAEVLQAARRKAEQLQLTAESQASTLKNGALHEAEKIRTAIQRESAALRARLADEREQQAKELADKHAQIAADTENLTTQMREAAEASERRVAEATEQARKIRAEAEESAERTINRARREAEQVLTTARTRADAELAKAADEAERSRTIVARETERLAKRRDGILTQIAGLNEIASNIARQAAELDVETAAPAYVSPFARPQSTPPGGSTLAADATSALASSDTSYDEKDADDGGPFTGASPFVGVGAGDARVDETRIDTNLKVDAKVADELAVQTAGGPVETDDEPADSTKVDAFRVDDLANEETRVQARPNGSADAGADDADAKIDAARSSARSPKGKK
jgi:vacuolar-type H+-ATPase subunit H